MSEAISHLTCQHTVSLTQMHCACVGTNACTDTHARSHPRTHAHTSTHARSHPRTHAHTHTHTHDRMLACTHSRTHAQEQIVHNVSTLTYPYTCTRRHKHHAHTHTQHTVDTKQTGSNQDLKIRPTTDLRSYRRFMFWHVSEVRKYVSDS